MQRCYGCMKEYSKEYDVCPYCGYIVGTEPEIKSHLFPGTKLADRYILGKAIGHGGFGITYIAWDDKIQKVVAIKEYFPNAFSTRSAGETQVSCYNSKAEAFFKEGIKKMLDEAKRLSKFSKNENIVDIYDFFEENHTAYIVMEYLEGKDLKKYLKENGEKLSPEKAVEIILPVINALEDMHKDSLIHRDISPDNIFICDNGKVKLLDFGSARLAVEDSDKSLSVMVKRGYAPKEQYASRSKQGPWTDVYAVCATLYRMITGVLPVESTERDDEELKSFSDSGVTGYEELEKVVFKGLEVEYAARIQSVSELKERLSKPIEKNSETIEEISEQPSAPERKKIKINAKAIAAAVAAVAVIVGAVFGIKAIKTKLNSDKVEVDESTSAATTIASEVIHEVYESFFESKEAKKYFEVSPAFSNYYVDNEEYNNYVNNISSVTKTVEYYDLDADSTDECVLSVCFSSPQSALDYYVYYIFDIEGEKVKCVDSASELCGAHRSLHRLQIYQVEGEYYIRKYYHDPHERVGSVYKYDGKTLNFVESTFISDLFAENTQSYETWTHFYTQEYDLYNKNSANYLAIDWGNDEFAGDHGIKVLSEDEIYKIIDAYDNNEVYHIPAREDSSVAETTENAEIVNQGTIGSAITWTFYKNGLLSVDGRGDIPNYEGDGKDRPWHNFEDQIKEVYISDGITSLGVNVFYDCDKIEKVTIGADVETIENYAFNECDKLAEVVIPDSVKSIGYSFAHSVNLQKVTIGKRVTYIESLVFWGCTSLQEILVDSENEDYSSDSNGVLFNYDKTLLIQYPLGNTRTSYKVPDSVTRIEDRAFSESQRLTKVTLPDGLTGIGYAAFEDCYNLTSINIPYGVEMIEDYTFSGCKSLTSVTIPDSVTSIGEGAFSRCESLTSVTIPDSVTSIGAWAFDDCNITDVYYSGTMFQWLSVAKEDHNEPLLKARIYYNS